MLFAKDALALIHGMPIKKHAARVQIVHARPAQLQAYGMLIVKFAV